MSAKCVLICFVVLIAVTPIIGYNVLTYCPLPTRSHYILCRGIVDALVDRGHEVTLIGAYKAENAKFTELIVPEILEAKDTHMMPGFDMSNRTLFNTFNRISTLLRTITEKVFTNKGVQVFMTDTTQKFDVVIFTYFMNEMAIGLGVKYDCPVISFSPMNLMHWLAGYTNNPISVATVPNIFTSFTGNMNLWERTINFLLAMLQEVSVKILVQPVQTSLYNKYFPEESKKVPYDELITQISGVLVNTHPSMGPARALLPNTVEIGGYHIKDPEPLPKDIKKILDEAENGVIYFSMGSNLKSSEMSPDLKSVLLKAFRNSKQTILWKYEEDLPEKSKNLIIRKWMPQTGILAHPNVKLFISHGGLLSCTEASHFGKPLLAIPIFGDQYHNSKMLQERGNGLYLEFSNITSESFEWVLNETLENPKFRNIAKEVQKLYYDRPMKPRDLLTYHVEHIIRTKGAKHLAPAPLCRHSYLLLDVIAVIVIPLIASAAIFSIVLRKCCFKSKRNINQIKFKKQ